MLYISSIELYVIGGRAADLQGTVWIFSIIQNIPIKLLLKCRNSPRICIQFCENLLYYITNNLLKVPTALWGVKYLIAQQKVQL